MVSKFKVFIYSFLLAFVSGVPNAGFAAGNLDISQVPLAVAVPVKPALLMAIDNSGSMDSEVIFGTNDGALWWNTNNNAFTGLGVSPDGNTDIVDLDVLNFNQAGGANGTWKKYIYLFPNGADDAGGHLRRYGDSTHDHYAIAPIPELAFARSPAYNRIYFDPFELYPPFPSAGSDTYTDADPKAAFYDAPRGNTTVDLTVPMESDDNNWVFRMYAGMEIPAGTRVKQADSSECGNVNGAAFSGWVTLASDITINDNNCSVAVSYFPATFWLPKGAPLPADYGFSGIPLSGGSAPNGDELLGYEIRPGNFATAAQYDAAIQAFANWFQYYRKRSLATRAAIGRAFNEVSFLRVGYFRINNRGNVEMRDLDDPDDRKVFFDWNYDLRANGGTPNKESVDHMGDQFRLTGDNAPVQLSCQRNFGMLFTDGYANEWNGAGVGNADDGLPAPLGDGVSNTMADIAYYHFDNNLRPDLDAGTVPVPAECGQADPPLDMNCNPDPHMTLYGVTLGTPGLIFGVDEAATADPWNNPPQWPGTFPNRHPSAVDDLWHATLNTRGLLFSTTRPGELVDALLSVLGAIEDSILPTGVAVSRTRLTTESLVYSGEFDSDGWTGEFKALDKNGVEVWDAEAFLSGPREIFTYSPGSNPVTGTPPFDPSGSGIEFTSGNTSIEGRVMASAPIEDDWTFPNVVNYVRGNGSLEERNGGPFRDREVLLGDIVSSRPVFSGRKNEGWARVYQDYIDYIDKDKPDPRGYPLDCEAPDTCEPKGTREETVFIGANAGMLHAFDARTGEEQFAYVPSSLHGNLFRLADPDYNNSHRFYVDGQVAVADARFGTGDWRTVLVGGLGAGGRGIYALDVTTPQTFDAADVLWEFTSEDDPDLGYTFGEPIISRLENGDWVAIFGNGYNSVNNQAFLYVLDLKTGAVKNKVSLGIAGDNGLSGVVGWRNAGTRSYLDRVYAGDLNGTMWRVDFESSVATLASEFASGLFTDPNGRPITSTPNLAAHPGGGLVVYYGSGKLIEGTDLDDLAVDRFYAVRDQGKAIENSTAAMNKFGEATESGGELINSDGILENGWFANLSPGERVLAQPRVIFGKFIASTYTPDSDPCSSGGTPAIYTLDALTGDGPKTEIPGGAPSSPPIAIRPQERTSPPDVMFPGTEDPDEEDPVFPKPADPTGTATARGWCSEFGIPPLFAGGAFVSLGTICEGRQVWREIR